MCLQCTTESEVIGHFPCGFILMKALKPDHEWKKWALVVQNDPSFTWEVDPIKDPSWGLDDDQLEGIDDSEFLNRLEEFEKCLTIDVMNGYDLVDACIESGYTKKAHGGRIGWWLFHNLAVQIEEYEERKLWDVTIADGLDE